MYNPATRRKRENKSDQISLFWEAVWITFGEAVTQLSLKYAESKCVTEIA